ncbi:MAG: hypothetical protein JW937_08455 [Candidatus Omnitrophica bacterium]|nr:hypothetical protein [Candidatus Omnitrophota bacterium]
MSEEDIILEQSILSRFNVAFSLMSVIPLLICFYLITVRFFSIQILVGLNGVYFLLGIIIAVLGLFFGREILKEIIRGLVRANARLARSTEELEKANEHIKAAQLQLIQAEKFESIGRLAMGVAHEVRNPLAIILMAVDSLDDTQDPAERKQLTAQIQKAVKRADRVIKGLTDLSLTSARDLRMECHSVNDVVKHGLILMEHTFKRRQICAKEDLDPNLPETKLDKSKLGQAILNLLKNAAEAMETDGVLTVRTRTMEMGVREHNAGRRSSDRFRHGEQVIVIEIEDEGHGIAQESIWKVFDPFFTTKPTGEGTGLGLPVARSVVELHGGELKLENREGGGVRASVSLKIYPPDPTD